MTPRLILFVVGTLTAVSALSVLHTEEDERPMGTSAWATMRGEGHGRDAQQDKDEMPRGNAIIATMKGDHDSQQAQQLDLKRSFLASAVSDYQADEKERAIANAMGSLDELLEKQRFQNDGRDAMAAPLRMGGRWMRGKDAHQEHEQVDDGHDDAFPISLVNPSRFRNDASLEENDNGQIHEAADALAYKRAALAIQRKRDLDKRFNRQPSGLLSERPSFRGLDQIWSRLDELKPPSRVASIYASRVGIDAFRGRDGPSSSNSWRGRDEVSE